MSNLITVPFHGQSIQAILFNDKPYVAMKPIVENIGLDWKSQHKKVNKHPVLSKGKVMMTLPSNGGEQEMLTLPLNLLNGWLFGIDANRVKPEIKDKLIDYQAESFEVLANHFMPEPSQPIPPQTTINIPQAEYIDLLQNKITVLSAVPKTPHRQRQSKTNEAAFIQSVIPIIRNKPGINKKDLLNALGKSKKDKTASNLLNKFEGIYWQSTISSNVYSYYLIVAQGELS